MEADLHNYLIIGTIWIFLAVALVYIANRMRHFRDNMLINPFPDEDQVANAVQTYMDKDKIAKQPSQSVARDIAEGVKWQDCFCVENWRTREVLLEGGSWGNANEHRDRITLFQTRVEAWEFAKNLMNINPMLRLEAKPIRWVAGNHDA